MPRPYRIAIGGYHIECSEFTPRRSGAAEFTVQRGERLLSAFPFVTGDASVLDPALVERFGAMEAIEGVEWVPLTDAHALPGGPVTAEFWQQWSDEFLSLLCDAHAECPLDAVVLDLHGASSVEGLIDAEGWLAAQVRQIVGAGVPVTVSMDPHGNVSDQLFAACDYLTSYRTAPHIDPLWTVCRAARAAVKLLQNPGRTCYRAKVDVPILLPGEKTSTEVEPGRSLYGQLYVYDLQDDVFDTAVWMGFPWADQERCHGAVVACGFDREKVEADAARVALDFWDKAASFEFVGPVDSAKGAIDQALAADVRPFFLSDTGDNPGAGGTDDSTVLLAGLLDAYREQGSNKRVVFASLNDPAAVEACVKAGEGAVLDIAVGAMTGGVSGEPVLLHGRVERLFDELRTGGASAVVAEGNFHVIVTTARTQFGSAAQYEAAGEPFADQDIVVVKMGYLEPDLSAAANGWVMALTPGAVDQDLPRLAHNNIRRPMVPFDELPFDPQLTVQVRSN